MLSTAFAFPMTNALSSLGVGCLVFLPLWVLRIRRAPGLSKEDVKKCTVLAMLHTTGHVGAVVAMSAGAVSFVHIIKALEPLFSVVFGFLIDGKCDAFGVNLWLVPIICGVGWAAVGSKVAAGDHPFADMNMVALGGAMISNVAFALRAILSKKFRAETNATNLTSANLYSVITLLSFILFAPFALVLEGSQLAAAWPPVANVPTTIPAAILGVSTFATDQLGFLLEMTLWTGFHFYIYNECAFLVLGEVSATAQAVANTVKRVVILLATVMFLGEKMDEHKAAGAAVAILATLAYSVAKSKSQAAIAAKKDQ